MKESLALDPLDYWARHLDGRSLGNNQARLDVALDYLRSSLYSGAREILASGNYEIVDGSVPMLLYMLGHIAYRTGEVAKAREYDRRASQAAPDYCFPSRLEEMSILEGVLERNPDDARAHYYLGNLLCDRRRHEEAIFHWESSAGLDPSFPVVWRNLGIAYFNIREDIGAARSAFRKAVQTNPGDARLLYERDQLSKRAGLSPKERLSELQNSSELAAARDDLTIELCSLYNDSGQPGKALTLLENRIFQPWEGGEGLVLGQWVRTQLGLARSLWMSGKEGCVQAHLRRALEPPENLSENWHLLANRSSVYYWLGIACEMAGKSDEAVAWWTRAAESEGDFQDMNVKQFSEMTYYSAMALIRLERAKEGESLLRSLLGHARGVRCTKAAVDYFATSLPAMLLFNDDLQKRRRITSMFLEGQAALGLGYTHRGRRLLRETLRLDPSHSPSMDLLSELEIEPILQNRRSCQLT